MSAHAERIAQIESRTEQFLQRAVAAQLMAETLEPERYDQEALAITAEYLAMSPGDRVIAFLVTVKANALNYLAAHPEQREAMARHADDIVNASRATRRTEKETQ